MKQPLIMAGVAPTVPEQLNMDPYIPLNIELGTNLEPVIYCHRKSDTDSYLEFKIGKINRSLREVIVISFNPTDLVPLERRSGPFEEIIQGVPIIDTDPWVTVNRLTELEELQPHLEARGPVVIAYDEETLQIIMEPEVPTPRLVQNTETAFAVSEEGVICRIIITKNIPELVAHLKDYASWKEASNSK